jgi:transposase InsO family protein
MEKQLKARENWVKLYLETKNAGYVCRHCGISRPTLRKWTRRYKENGIEGLADQSKKPKLSPNKKMNDEFQENILNLRSKRNLGARRIQSELIRLHNAHFSLATIHKVLVSKKVNPIKKLKRKKVFKRYQRPIAGDRVQIDTCKIAPGIYQYTAVDDCTRFRVLEIYTRRTAANTLEFLDKMMEEFPFPIQRIQSDRGREFFAIVVQEKLKSYCIKFRPNKPASPHLNGKVERSQKTDLEEFYATTELTDFNKLRVELAEWQFFYNWQRPHGALSGKTPLETYCDVSKKTPFWDEVQTNYDPKKEHLQDPNYHVEMTLRKLKRSL